MGVFEGIIIAVPVPIGTGYNQVVVVLILRAVCDEIYSSNSFTSGLFKLLQNSSGVASSLVSPPALYVNGISSGRLVCVLSSHPTATLVVMY